MGVLSRKITSYENFDHKYPGFAGFLPWFTVTDKGMEFKDAIVEASRIRLRPVVMTAFAAVMGSVPLIFASGPGSASRSALGVVIFSGVSFATFFTLFIVPAVYNLMARGTGSPNAVAHRLKAMSAVAASAATQGWHTAITWVPGPTVWVKRIMWSM